MNTLKQYIPEIDSIDKAVTSVSAKLINMETEVTYIEKRVGEVETSCACISNKSEDNNFKN